MNGSPSVRVALFIRESGSESPCRWFYVTGIYTPFSAAGLVVLFGIYNWGKIVEKVLLFLGKHSCLFSVYVID